MDPFIVSEESNRGILLSMFSFLWDVLSYLILVRDVWLAWVYYDNFNILLQIN